MVLLILVLKCYFSYKQSQSHDLARREMGELRETQLHLTSQIVATQGQTELAEERLAHKMQHRSLERRRRELARTAARPRSHSLGVLNKREAEADEESQRRQEEESSM